MSRAREDNICETVHKNFSPSDGHLETISIYSRDLQFVIGAGLSIRMVVSSRKLLIEKSLSLRRPDTYRIHNYCLYLSVAS
jgi:hypothetical protein